MPSDLITAAREVVLGVSTLRQAQDGADARASLLDRRAGFAEPDRRADPAEPGRRADAGAPDHRAILGITGCPGAGKSTLAERIERELNKTLGLEPGVVVRVPMDGFHLADAALTALGRLDRKGAIDTFDAYGYLALLRRLRADGPETVYVPDFDRTIEQPVAGSIAVGPRCRLVITEGNYLLADAEPWPAVRAQLDEVWFCDLADDERRRRLIARHVRFGKAPDDAARWVAEVDERNARLVRATRDRADVVVETDYS